MPDAIPFNRSAKADAAPKSDASAEELLAFERMLADLSARFANIPAELVEAEIQVTQTILRQFSGSIAAPLPNSRRTVRLSFYLLRPSTGSSRRHRVPFLRIFPGLLPNFAPARSSRYKTLPMIFPQKRSARPSISSTVRYLGIEVDDALAIAEQVDI
jgi:hypothetical protein